jgi:hypothetical protein
MGTKRTVRKEERELLDMQSHGARGMVVRAVAWERMPESAQ